MKKVSKAPAKNKKSAPGAKKASDQKASSSAKKALDKNKNKNKLAKGKSDKEKNKKDVKGAKSGLAAKNQKAHAKAPVAKASKKPEVHKKAVRPAGITKHPQKKSSDKKNTEKSHLFKPISAKTKKVQEIIASNKKKQEEQKNAAKVGKKQPASVKNPAKDLKDVKSGPSEKIKERKVAPISGKKKNKGGKKDQVELESYEDNNEDGLLSKPSDDDEDDDFEVMPVTKPKMVFDKEEDLEDDFLTRKKAKSTGEEDVKDLLAEEILSLAEDFSINEIFASIRNMELFKIETDECVVRGCDNPATTAGYCRYHYIKLWKDIQKKQLILSEGRLAKIIEDLVAKYPVKFIETIIQDLADDKAFNSVLKDLDIETDEAEMEGFDDDELLDDDQDIAFETKVVKPSFDD